MIMVKQIAVDAGWVKTCGLKSPTGLVDAETWNPIFDVIRVDDFGSRGKMYKVKLAYGDWTVWSLRGVKELVDEVADQEEACC
ncbi:hypothetical protein EVC30_075 [Rhizobium phage RHph_Y1_11]|nr:hypothetical protein EVC30_075 [Rhizobium phage RHph_Y1_11]